MTTRLAVIGGRGWLGEAIAATARERGADVVVLARTDAPGARAVDFSDTAALARALAGCDVVVNAAGRTGGDPVSMRAANQALPDRLGALAVAGGWRLVHLGSAAEYGPPTPGAVLVPEGYPTTPGTPYGRTKLAGTEAVLRWQERGARAVVARVFNVVGDRHAGRQPGPRVRRPGDGPRSGPRRGRRHRRGTTVGRPSGRSSRSATPPPSATSRRSAGSPTRSWRSAWPARGRAIRSSTCARALRPRSVAWPKPSDAMSGSTSTSMTWAGPGVGGSSGTPGASATSSSWPPPPRSTT